MQIKKMTGKIIIFLLLLPVLCFSQSNISNENSRFSLSLSAGLNVSKFRKDSLIFNYGTKPFIGTSWSVGISQRLGIKGDVVYSKRGSNAVNSGKKIENQYIDLTLCPRFNVTPDFHLHAGLAFSNLLKSNEIINNGSHFNGIERKEIQGYTSELNVITGAELNLHKNLTIFLNYTIPTNKLNTSNYQIGVNLKLTDRIKKEPSFRRKRINASRNQINQLKKSVLLVRLKTSENAINALINEGQGDKALKLKLKQEEANKKIVSAFTKNFTFCEVRYFFSSNSEKVKQKQFDSVFLNDSLQVDNSIKLDTNRTFFIAEFGFLEQDTNKIFSHYSYEPSQNGGLEKVANYYSTSSDNDFYVLRILDKNFVQLSKPFPFYTRAIYKTMSEQPEQFMFIHPLYLVFLTWTYDDTVLRMNKKLERFYGRNM